VDDGSSDQTWPIISTAASNARFGGIKLSRNRGHQAALMAGLLSSQGEVTISVDADLQDDLEAIGLMLAKHREGAEIVYGVRSNRKTDSFLKRVTAETFYRLIARLGVESVFNHADYRLMSRRAINFLNQYGERNLYLRGMVPQIGLKTAVVEYARNERFAGQSKYPVSKMLALAWEAVTSFSNVPLRFVTKLGFLIFAGTVFASVWIAWARFFTNSVVPGWASTVLPMFFLGGIQLLCLGIIGEYLGKVYTETKQRPRFFVDKKVGSYWKDHCEANTDLALSDSFKTPSLF
jgi:polyisoprenyl-phosphate glycosyltransferase